MGQAGLAGLGDRRIRLHLHNFHLMPRHTPKSVAVLPDFCRKFAALMPGNEEG
jgi:hypothetical protein